MAKNRFMMNVGMDETDATMTFYKTGGEIKTSIEKKVREIAADVEKIQSDVAVLCKKREIDPKTVLNVDVTVGTQNYTSSAVVVTQDAVKEFQADLSKLTSLLYQIDGARTETVYLETVKRNIDNDEGFNLTYPYLVRFGF